MLPPSGGLGRCLDVEDLVGCGLGANCLMFDAFVASLAFSSRFALDGEKARDRRGITRQSREFLALGVGHRDLSFLKARDFDATTAHPPT